MVAFLLLVVGGLNWLLVGLFSWDIGMLFGGQGAIISRIVYLLVGISALYEISTHKINCKTCSEECKDEKKPATPTTPATPSQTT